jgi:hypothetical protein
MCCHLSKKWRFGAEIPGHLLSMRIIFCVDDDGADDLFSGYALPGYEDAHVDTTSARAVLPCNITSYLLLESIWYRRNMVPLRILPRLI